MSEFFGIDARFVLRTIAVEEKEHQRPDDAQHGENVEYPAPAPCVHDHNREQRRNHHGEAAETMGHALDESALGFWKPKLHRAACRWKGTGFSQTKGKADRKEGRRTRPPGRCRRHQRPERHDRQKYPLRPEEIGEPAARNLTRRISPGEGAEEQRDFRLAETELLGNGRRRNGNIAAIHVGDHVHQADQQKDVPPDIGSLHTEELARRGTRCGDVRGHDTSLESLL
jgi:hypothetical protein